MIKGFTQAHLESIWYFSEHILQTIEWLGTFFGSTVFWNGSALISSQVLKKLPKSQFLNWIYSSFSFLFFSLAPSNIPYIIPVLLLLHILCSFAAKQKGIPSDVLNVLHNGLYLVFYYFGASLKGIFVSWNWFLTLFL